jgi:hypothetical protein
VGSSPAEIPPSAAGRLRSLTPVRDAEPVFNQQNYRITDGDKIGVGSLRQKFRDNLAAIELLKRLEAEQRPATNQEKGTLVRYVGWGGLPQVFDPFNKEWAKECERLEKLLTPEELDSARASTLNAHYTAPLVIRAMYDALQGFGFEEGTYFGTRLRFGTFHRPYARQNAGAFPGDGHRN